MSSLEKLYYNMDKLVDGWDDSQETQDANSKLEQAMGNRLYARFEDEILCCHEANEKQGFIEGFRYAVALLTDARAVGLREWSVLNDMAQERSRKLENMRMEHVG